MWGEKRHFSSYYQVKSRLSFDSCCGRLLFQKYLENSISVHRNGKLNDSRRSTTIPSTSGRRLAFKRCFFFWWPHVIWSITIHDKRWKQKNIPWQEDGRVLFEDLFCNVLNCLRSFWQHVFLSIQTSMSALLTAPVTTSVSTQREVSSASVIKATSSTAWHTVEVSQHASSLDVNLSVTLPLHPKPSISYLCLCLQIDSFYLFQFLLRA